jgi:hypothetical protein
LEARNARRPEKLSRIAIPGEIDVVSAFYRQPTSEFVFARNFSALHRVNPARSPSRMCAGR